MVALFEFTRSICNRLSVARFGGRLLQPAITDTASISEAPYRAERPYSDLLRKCGRKSNWSLHLLWLETSPAGSLRRENQRYIAGTTSSVRIVEVTSPPITTAASGRCTSLPVPVASSSGISPRAVVTAVISTGRRRSDAP